MKTPALLLTLSLAANAALAFLLFRQPAAAPESAATGASAVRVATASVGSDSSRSAEALRAALASRDPAALEAAGLPADVARELALGRAFTRMAERIRAQSANSDGKWWKNRTNNSATREEQLAARRELSEALIAAFGDDLGFGGPDLSGLSFLPADKRLALRRITQDYDEMLAKFGGDGVQLASDREKQKLLRAERDRDIAALLSPQELAAYEMRTSASAATVRARYGDAIESEEDFKKIYALQKAFDEKNPPFSGRVTNDQMAARSEAAQKLQADLRAAVGEEKFAALRRAADPEVRTLDSLATRLNLAAGTTDRILSTRETYAAESQRINADTALNAQQRRAQIQDLGNRARAEVARTLGSEATEAYAQRTPWINMLQGGMAFSTTPQANSPGGITLGGTAQSVFPVMPAGATTPGAARQVFVSGVSAVQEAPAGGVLSLSAGVPVQRENVQMMTFTTEGGPNVVLPAGSTATVITNGQPPPAPTPTPKP